MRSHPRRALQEHSKGRVPRKGHVLPGGSQGSYEWPPGFSALERPQSPWLPVGPRPRLCHGGAARALPAQQPVGSLLPAAWLLRLPHAPQPGGFVQWRLCSHCPVPAATAAFPPVTCPHLTAAHAWLPPLPADSPVPRRAVALSRAVPRLPPPLCRVCVPGKPPAMLAACHAHSDPRPRAPTVGPELHGTATSRPQTLTLSSARALGAPSRPSRGRALWPCPSGQSWGPSLALTPHPHHVAGACSRLRLSRAL